MIPSARRSVRASVPAVCMSLVSAALLAGCGGSAKKAATTRSTTTGAAGPAPAAATAPAAGSVTIEGFKYGPPAVSANVGATLTFKNADTAEHTATADMRSAFDTGAIARGRSKTITFTKAGTFAYHCDFHPFMHGTVVVKPAAGTARPAPAAPRQGAPGSSGQGSSPSMTPKTGRSGQSGQSGGVDGGQSGY